MSHTDTRYNWLFNLTAATAMMSNACNVLWKKLHLSDYFLLTFNLHGRAGLSRGVFCLRCQEMEQSIGHFNYLKAKCMWETFAPGWVYEWEEKWKETFNNLAGKKHMGTLLLTQNQKQEGKFSCLHTYATLLTQNYLLLWSNNNEWCL